jgi:ribosomal protein S18 acetylase RimI-like enzyme
MDFRLAVMQDLPRLKAVYKDIIQNMNDNQIEIWDDIYPCEFFEEDIKNKQLYVLYDKTELVSAFVLCSTNSGEKSVNWKDNAGKALYIDRFGVNVNYAGKGIGSFMLTKARETAKTLGAEYLRLFVVDINEPAICLYTKNGFTKATGVYDEVIDDDLVLHEYGYEILL